MPLITITNKSDIRSCMIQEAQVVDTIPKSPKVPKKQTQTSKSAVKRFMEQQQRKQAEEI